MSLVSSLVAMVQEVGADMKSVFTSITNEETRAEGVEDQLANDIADETTNRNTALGYKADITYVDDELDLKSDLTYVNTELDLKADLTYTNTKLDLKSDLTYVDNELDLKSDLTYVNTELGTKATVTYVDDELALKSNITYVDYELGLKADKQYVEDEFIELLESAPEVLDTLNELAAALGDDPNYAATTASLIGQKANSVDVYTKTESDSADDLKADITYVDDELYDHQVEAIVAQSSALTRTLNDRRNLIRTQTDMIGIIDSAINVANVGPTGLRGLTGPIGLTGLTGADSTVQGPQGIQGETGADSTVQGPQGDQGIQGDQGDQGADSVVVGPTGPIGADSKTVDFVASGTLPDGIPVILNSDGTVEAVAEVGQFETIPAGAVYSEDTGAAVLRNAVTFDVNNPGRFIISRSTGLVVGTVAGTTITFGAETIVSLLVVPEIISLPGVPDKFILLYHDGYTPLMRVLTVTGTSISVSEYINLNILAGGFSYGSLAADPHNVGQFIMVFNDGVNGSAMICTLTGDDVTIVGTKTTIAPGLIYRTGVEYDPITPGKFVAIYIEGNNAGFGSAIVGTLINSQITVGRSTVFSSTAMSTDITPRISFDPNNINQLVVAYQDGVGGVITVGTVSGPDISFSNEYEFIDTGALDWYIDMDIDPTTGQVIVVYKDPVAAGNLAIVGTFTGSALSFGTPYSIDTTATHRNSVTFDPHSTGKFIVGYANSTNTNEFSACVGHLTSTVKNLTSDNFLGTSSAAYTSGQTAAIVVNGGTSRNQSGLTVGETYYVQAGGTLATTPDSPSVKIGKAISDTDLLIVGTSGVDGTDATANISHQFLATSDIPNGAPVILKGDGTVEAVVELGKFEAIPDGAFYKSDIKAYALTENVIRYDENNADKFLMAFVSGAGAPEIVVGTLSGTSISYGTPVEYTTPLSYTPIELLSLPGVPDKFILLYGANTGLTYTRVVTVTGTDISMTEPVAYSASTAYYATMVADPYNVGQFFIAASEYALGQGIARVGTLTGDTITWGTLAPIVDVNVTQCTHIQNIPSSPGKFLLYYMDTTDSYGKVVIGTVVGTDITFGTPVTLTAGITHLTIRPKLSFNPTNDNEFIIVYQDASTSYAATVSLGTISGDDITFGTPVIVDSVSVNTNLYIDIAFDPAGTGEFVIVYNYIHTADSRFVVVGTLLDQAITFGTPSALSSSPWTSVRFDPNHVGKFIVASASLDTFSIEVFVGQLSATTKNLQPNNYLGMSTNAYSNGDTATIMVQGGIATNQTGLTVGEDYYVQVGGTLSTIPDIPSVKAGFALSDTTLRIPIAAIDGNDGTDGNDGNITSFTASGALPDGVPVVLKADGTVEVVGYPVATSIDLPASASGNDDASTTAITLNSVAMDVNTPDRFMVARNGSLVLGTISGTDITFGAETVYGAGLTYPELICLPGVVDTFVLMYYVGPTYIVKATVSGTTITLGTPHLMGDPYHYFGIGADPHNPGQFAATSSNTGLSIGTLTGDTFTFGAAVSLGTAGEPRIQYDPINAGKLVVAYPTSYGTMIVASHDSNSVITLGTPVVYSSVGATVTDQFTEVAFDPSISNKLVIIWRDSVQGLTVALGTISGLDVSFSDNYIISSATTGSWEKGISFDTDNNGNFLVAYKEHAVTTATILLGNLSESGLTFSVSSTFDSVAISTEARLSLHFDPNIAGKFIVNYMSPTDSTDHLAIVGDLITSNSNLSLNNFIGIPVNAYSDGDSASIMLQGGVVNNQSGLTTGANYYVQGDGTLSTYPGTVSVRAGRAVSSTSLQIATDGADGVDGTNGVSLVASGEILNGAPVILKSDGTVEAVDGNLTVDNFIGMSVEAYIDGDLAHIVLKGSTSNNQTGLTIGTVYYVQSDGTLSITPDTPSVVAGMAISATSLLVAPNVLHGVDGVDGASGDGVDFIAASDIPNGSPVVLNPDGTINAVVALSELNQVEAIPAGITYTSATTAVDGYYQKFTYDENNANKFILGHVGSDPSISVGTISGTTVTYGTPFDFDPEGDSLYGYSAVNIISLPGVPDKFILTYGVYLSVTYSRVLTITGTSISMSARTLVGATDLGSTKLVSDPNNVGQFFLVATQPPLAQGVAMVGNLVGDTITWGTPTEFNTDTTTGSQGNGYCDIQISPSSEKIVVSYTDQTNAVGKVVIGTVVGTDITFGVPTTYMSSSSGPYNPMSFNPVNNDQFLICFNTLTTGHGISDLALGTISGDSVTISTQITFGVGGSVNYDMSVVFDPNGTGDFMLTTHGNNYTTTGLWLGNVTGTTITLGDPYLFNTKLDLPGTNIKFDPHYIGKFVVLTRNPDNFAFDTFVGQLEVNAFNLSLDNFVGISNNTYSNGDTANIAVQGNVSTNQTGLTIGSTYYVQKDGTLEITPDDISVLAGKALSSTSLLIAAFGSSVGSSENVYATGGTVTEADGYRYHTFTESGALTSTVGSFLSYLVVGGGGGGAHHNTSSNGGGGGAGGFLTSDIVSTGVITITIGAGGAPGVNGGDTSFGDVTALGGGGGGFNGVGLSGGSGGGGAGISGTAAGGDGTVGQGNDGGTGISGGNWLGGGGGGAGAVGADGGGSVIKDSGGDGLEWLGLGTVYAGGGGGGGNYGAYGLGGDGGGGRGGTNVIDSAVAGTENTGGGGGGSGSATNTAASGGSGIVIIRYAI